MKKYNLSNIMSRSPRGERGLKYQISCILKSISKSLPSRGARVEMLSSCLPACRRRRSLPSRGARVEISLVLPDLIQSCVAPHPGSEG